MIYFDILRIQRYVCDNLIDKTENLELILRF